jgi:molybdate transport system regulatory protein
MADSHDMSDSPSADGALHAGSLHAALLMRRGDGMKIGAERIALLEKVGELGSIAAAAKALDMSYKSAWDSVQALNNLFEHPLVLAHPGGRQGGATAITEQGRTVIQAFRLLEAELAQTLNLFERRLSTDSVASLDQLLRGFSMKSSARNALRGTVARITADTVSAEVVLRMSERVEIAAVISRRSLDALGLQVGSEAVALIKASFVILAADEGEGARTSARNQLAGTVIERIDGEVNSEVTLELDAGKTLTATLTRTSADALALAEGSRALALVKASHVILVVD